MILIADSGSTKTSWRLADNSGKGIEFETTGYNPCYANGDDLIKILKLNLPDNFDMAAIDELAFYGAGIYKNKINILRNALQPIFPNARIEVVSDLTGAARSLLGRSPGFAAILGTGANSCLYDGDKIIKNISPLGFLLGDEGSGAYMGKIIIRDYIREYMPKELRNIFWQTYKLNSEQLIEQIYSAQMPNRYCASFTRFLTGSAAGHEYFEQRVIRDSFRCFFNSIVKLYPDYKKYSLNCVGSTGWIFREQLAEIAAEFGMKTGKIIANPMEGLVNYHSK